MSNGVEAMKMPDRPPIMNIDTNDSACSIGVSRRMSAFQSVPSHLNALIALGTAMTIVVIMNVDPSSGFMPLMNMWWPHTIQPRNAIATIAKTIEWYPQIGFWLAFVLKFETTPT